MVGKLVMALLLLVPFSSLSEEKSAGKAPEISKDTIIEYFKASAQQAQAQIAVDQAQKNLEQRTQVLQQIAAKIAQECGEKFQPSISQQGNVECVARPAATPKPAK